MPRSSSKPALLLGGVGALLVLGVGLVGSVRRGPTRVRPMPALSTVQRSPRPTPLGIPEVPEPLSAPPSAPSERAEPDPVPPTAAGEAPRDLALLRGFVLRADGQPASRGRVVLGKQHIRCDTQGHFEMGIAGGVSGTDLVAWEPGSEPTVRPGFGTSLELGGEFQVRLVLGPETLALSGSVVDGEGRSVKGWTVELDGPDLLRDFGLRERVRSDEDGEFVLEDVPRGSYVLRAFKQDPASAFRSLPVAAGENGIRILVE